MPSSRSICTQSYLSTYSSNVVSIVRPSSGLRSGRRGHLPLGLEQVSHGVIDGVETVQAGHVPRAERDRVDDLVLAHTPRAPEEHRLADPWAETTIHIEMNH